MSHAASAVVLHPSFSTSTFSAYQALAEGQPNGTTDLPRIIAEVEKYVAQNQPVQASVFLVKHREFILGQIHRPEIQKLTALALRAHNLALAESFLTQARQQGDAFAEARILLEITKYHAALENWDFVTQVLLTAHFTEGLDKDSAAEANLLAGSALQKQKKHREAMKFYAKVPADSIHYRVAQLNLATANIRQEWWTDAHDAIKQALTANTAHADELDYRLYTLLGFSQIQFGFYRDARENFRKVSLTSNYTHRALLGLGLAALHQKDYRGALNAFSHLREKKAWDISVAESYLLTAFTLRQLRQYDKASDAYQQAIDYYADLQQQQAALVSRFHTYAQTDSNTFSFLRPESQQNKPLQMLAEQLNLLTDLANYPLADSLKQSLRHSQSQLQAEYADIALSLLQREQQTIASYLSQSKFGLAAIYDEQ